MRWWLVAAGAIALLGSATTGARASAFFEPIQLVSKSSAELADDASEPALSLDGRYVVFRGSIGGWIGIFRKDLQSGSVDSVAARDAYSTAGPLGGATFLAPSISADGRYVGFTTTAGLDPADDDVPTATADSDVYVRDMSAEAPVDSPCVASAPCPYELASARDGLAAGLSYASNVGSLASGRVALSANGRQVAFITRAASNLGGSPGDTPERQVLLRNLDTDETTLVSQTADSLGGAPQPVPGGAVMRFGSFGEPQGATLSADGSTVAWLGTHLPAQVPLLEDEEDAIVGADEGESPYDEPLWRRVVDGPAAPIRRVVGGGDPVAPGCPPAGTLADPACQGPFTELGTSWGDCVSGRGWLSLNQEVDTVPQLSGDGRTVALIGEPNGFSNLFVVDMRDGLARGEAVHQVTREVPTSRLVLCGPLDLARLAVFQDIAISLDGSRIAFATRRQEFPLAPPNLLSPPPSEMGLDELYRIDLDRETLERVTGEADGAGPSLGGEGARGASYPSFDADGRTLAFSSGASNLVAGDANEASDVFTVADRPPVIADGEVSISPLPVAPPPRPRRKLILSATSSADGSVRLTALVPGAGMLRVRADAVTGARLRSRRVASGRRRARAEGLLVLRLEPARPRFRRLARVEPGFVAVVRAAFAQPGRKALRGEVEVRFHAHGKVSKEREGGR